MINFERENTGKNAQILLSGIWYSELPDIFDMDIFKGNITEVLRMVEQNGYDSYKKIENGLITDMNNIVSPDYLRQPGVEPIIYYTFKKNQSLREMQIPNPIHYISFIYNSLWIFEDLFEKLYLDLDYKAYVDSSNSYIVFGEEFNLATGYDEWQEIELGVFVSSNSKIQGNQVMITNKERYELAAETYRYGMKMDIESFFPNIYTHYLDKIKNMEPYNRFQNVQEYFTFLDVYHQRINNNQTKGIPAGVFSAHLASELLMLCVDSQIKKVIEVEHMGYIRYVDDLTFFADSKEELQKVSSKVQKILNGFRLRVNSNKNELFSNAKRIQNTDLIEIEKSLPWLLSDTEENLTIELLYFLKRYIAELLELNQISQIKTILTLLNKSINSNKLNLNGMEYTLVCYCQVLLLENPNLTCHGYKIINSVMDRIDNLERYIQLLKKKTNVIDTEYEDTLIQIWHYFVLLRHLEDEEKTQYLVEKIDSVKNPIILSMFVIKGEKRNTKLFDHIVETFRKELNNNNSDWKRKIMYSRWWLPLYRIWMLDKHNYMAFMQTTLFPKVLKDLGKVQ